MQSLIERCPTREDEVLDWASNVQAREFNISAPEDNLVLPHSAPTVVGAFEL